MKLGDDYRLMPNLPGWNGPEDEPRVRVGECPVCGVWRELRTGRVVGHQLNNGELCRGSGLKPTDEDVS